MMSQARSIAHCSMFARACKIPARFFRERIWVGDTVFERKVDSRGGIAGGEGAEEERFPMEVSFPVRKRWTAWRVRFT